MSNSSVLINLLQALAAMVLGNVAYFFLAPSLHLQVVSHGRELLNHIAD